MDSFSIWHWLVILAIALIAVAAIATVRRRSRVTGEPEGVGGWLVLPIIGFIAVIVLTLINLIGVVHSIEGLKLIFTDTTRTTSSLRLPVLLSLLFGIAVVISASICLYKIFVSKHGLRKFAVVHYVILLISGFVELWVDNVLASVLPSVPRDPDIAREAVRGVIAAAIWIPYFLVSKRVANTFENKTAPAI